ncbi:hypothetical protein T4B_6959 [Trichinella pseudospiralis]|uniref:Uncharacterized protein n=1 Tax=Trichinella pseudospiralis TaxID=6337 RepID=A0A0V1J7W2_TRIPS|nr:hypothetical protein T4A_3903 [Trichinella pseudospiralis]KRZ31079.1 hypothetical protein T4B_6959 [Trichinella pseudospiralis]KRZ43228.1 hypothetical protein T4C_7684 [Trichinella pseudospiralis]
MDQFIEQNSIDEQSSKARRDVLEMISCNQEIVHEKKHKELKLSMLDSFITKKSKAGLSSQ